MNESDKKIKKVSLPKLEKLSNEELTARIKAKDVRIKEKLDYYNKLHSLNLARLATYRKYKEDDARACAEVLNKRKNAPAVIEKKVIT